MTFSKSLILNLASAFVGFVSFSQTTYALKLSDPIINVALAPPEGSQSVFDSFASEEAKLESQGLTRINDAMNQALARAQGKIDAVLHGSFLQEYKDDVLKQKKPIELESFDGHVDKTHSLNDNITSVMGSNLLSGPFHQFANPTSFLSLKSESKSPSNEIFIRVHESPQSLSTGRAEKLESLRNSMEAKEVAQAAAEFDTLTNVVVDELRRAAHRSFLQVGSGYEGGHVDVKVRASDIAWPSTIGLLRGTESRRNVGERAFQGKILDLQTQYLQRLNAMIAKNLG